MDNYSNLKNAFNEAVQVWHKVLSGKVSRIVFWSLISRYINPSIQDELQNAIMINSKEQIEAEKEIIRLLDMDYSKHNRRIIKTNRITRSTEWSKTIEKTWPQIHQFYIKNEVMSLMDDELISSLIMVANNLYNILSNIDKHEIIQRRRKLKTTIEKVMLKNTLTLSTVKINAIEKIRYIDKKAYSKLSNVYQYWAQSVTESDFTFAFEIMNKEANVESFNNENIVLEFVTTTMILNELIKQGWKINYKSLFIQITNSHNLVPYAELHKNDVLLKLGKGNSKLSSEDRINWIREKLIYNVIGNQPDITLTFLKNDKEIVIIGDAKNNSDEVYIGVAYDAALIYALSFGNKVNLELRYDNDKMVLESDVYPFVTLFFAKDVRYDKSIQDIKSYMDFEIQKDKLPVLSLDLSHIRPQSKYYVLDTWVTNIEKQVLASLEK